MIHMPEKKKIELLAPAGGMDQLHYAVYYGADAVYMGADRFGLRARATNFTLGTIPEAVKFAHSHGVKVHVAMNVLMKDQDLKGLGEYAKALEDAGVDALIVSDLGGFATIREVAPGLELHVSTQASCANSASAKVWYNLGAKRVVCAREMSLKDIKTMREEIPEDMEIEAFVHGAMCMSISGRCLISDYVTGRKANKGACTQPCRWNYKLLEETRPGEYFEIGEDENGSFLLNSKDMNMLSHLPEVIDAGVDSIKIEGRNKKAFYVANVVNAYRQVLDGADPRDFQIELEKISHRPYNTGFYFGMAEQETKVGGQIQDCIHVATVEGSTPLEDGNYRVEVKCQNRMRTGDEIEIVSPSVPVRTCTVGEIEWESKPGTFEVVPSANRSMETYYFVCPFELKRHDLIRMDMGKYRAEVEGSEVQVEEGESDCGCSSCECCE